MVHYPHTQQFVVERYRMNDAYCGLSEFAYDINSLLSQGVPLDLEQTRAVGLLDEATNQQARSTSTRVFFRGCSSEAFAIGRNGSSFSSQAFLSMSSNPVEAAKFSAGEDCEPGVLLRIEFPLGYPFLSLSVEESLEANEFLTPRGIRFGISSWDGREGIEENQAFLLGLQLPPNVDFYLLKAPAAKGASPQPSMQVE